MDLDGPFRGSAAVAAGELTGAVLRGPRYRRLFRDTYVPAELVVDDQERAVAAAVAVATEPDGVVAGWSAAELLKASCGPPDAAPEVILRSRTHRRVPGVAVHRDALRDDEIVTVRGVPVTSPLRTAFDLARWRSRLEGVIAVDALARRHRFAPGELRVLRVRHPDVPGLRMLDDAIRRADPRAASPMETRIRIALTDGGCPPAVQHRVAIGGRTFYLDHAYPEHRIAVEYDGGHHRTQAQARLDLEREALLVAAGWTVLRFDAYLVLQHPDVVAYRTLRALQDRV